MIPAHCWGGSPYRVGGRAAVSSHPSWVVVSPEVVGDEGRDLTGDATIRAVLSPIPGDAWRGTAGELAARLAPVVGGHCVACDDAGYRQCMHDLSDDGDCPECDGVGEVRCGCLPPRERTAVIRGERYDAHRLLVLRGMLHYAGTRRATAAWVSSISVYRLDGAAELRAGVLVVDVDGWRYALAPLRPDDSGEITEVPL